jgi:predicted N-formylglutamate amidohydrolase
MSYEALVLTCEHATNHVPQPYAPLFRGLRRQLDGHRGYDIGAAQLARTLARALDAPLFLGPVTRLLVDLNRSEHHRSLTAVALSAAERRRVLDRYYRPYRDQCESALREHVSAGRQVLHVSVHSFTGVLAGEVRRADIGLLYDPARPGEKALCARWKAAIADVAPHLQIRRNYPYRGTSDGFGPALRQRLPASRYLCVELEINQRTLSRAADEVTAAVVHSLRAL